MNYKTFREKRNKLYEKGKKEGKITTPLSKCRYCDYQPKDYMDFVEHKEEKHGIKRGAPDAYIEGS